MLGLGFDQLYAGTENHPSACPSGTYQPARITAGIRRMAKYCAALAEGPGGKPTKLA